MQSWQWGIWPQTAQMSLGRAQLQAPPATAPREMEHYRDRCSLIFTGICSSLPLCASSVGFSSLPSQPSFLISSPSWSVLLLSQMWTYCISCLLAPPVIASPPSPVCRVLASLQKDPFSPLNFPSPFDMLWFLIVALGFNPRDWLFLTEWRGILSLQKTSEDPTHSAHSTIVCFLPCGALDWISHGRLAPTGPSTSAWRFSPRTHMTGHVWTAAFTLMARIFLKNCFQS